MATEGYRDFQSLDPVEEPSNNEDDRDAEWIESEAIDEEGWTIVGELVRIQEDAGEYDSRLYELQVDLGEYRVMWGRKNIDLKVDSAGIETGEVIGIRNTGETFETENGEGYVFDVRRMEQGGD
jgi:hypothetical protein